MAISHGQRSGHLEWLAALVDLVVSAAVSLGHRVSAAVDRALDEVDSSSLEVADRVGAKPGLSLLDAEPAASRNSAPRHHREARCRELRSWSASKRRQRSAVSWLNTEFGVAERSTHSPVLRMAFDHREQARKSCQRWQALAWWRRFRPLKRKFMRGLLVWARGG
jgi:hypothetical protein